MGIRAMGRRKRALNALVPEPQAPLPRCACRLATATATAKEQEQGGRERGGGERGEGRMAPTCIAEVVVAVLWDEMRRKRDARRKRDKMRRKKLRRCSSLEYWVWPILEHRVSPILVSLRQALRLSLRQREVGRGAGREPMMLLGAERSRSVGRRRVAGFPGRSRVWWCRMRAVAQRPVQLHTHAHPLQTLWLLSCEEGP